MITNKSSVKLNVQISQFLFSNTPPKDNNIIGKYFTTDLQYQRLICKLKIYCKLIVISSAHVSFHEIINYLRILISKIS